MSWLSTLSAVGSKMMDLAALLENGLHHGWSRASGAGSRSSVQLLDAFGVESVALVEDGALRQPGNARGHARSVENRKAVGAGSRTQVPEIVILLDLMRSEFGGVKKT